jgi:Leucine-rich repeat (LRR) protein
MPDPSLVVLREFDAVAKRAQNFAAAISAANRLPDDFPKEQVKDICESLVLLPFGTTQGGRDQLGYANLRLPDVRGEFFSLEQQNEDGQPIREETLDDTFSLLIAAVATAIGTIDREAGKRPPEEPPALRYGVDPSDTLIAGAMTSGRMAIESLDRIGQSLKDITNPHSENADRLRRRVSDGSGLVRMAKAEIGFHKIVPVWTRKLGESIDTIPVGLRNAADLIDLTIDLASPYIEQWSEIKRDIRQVITKHIKQFTKNLRTNADRIQKKSKRDGQLRFDHKRPPTDFSIGRVINLLVGSGSVPDDWIQWVTKLDLSGLEFSDCTSLEAFVDLQELDLSDTKITDATSLKNLVNLKKLNLSRNKITNIESLQNLSNLTNLSLSDTKISNFEPLRYLTDLKELNLSYNKFNNIKFLKSLLNLENLWLYNTPITDLNPIKRIFKLRLIDLSGTNISNVKPLDELVNLEFLNLRRTAVTDMKPLKGLIKLRSLDLRETAVSDVTHLRGLSNLYEVDLAETKITDITPLNKLRELNQITVKTNSLAVEFQKQLGNEWLSRRFVGEIYKLLRDTPTDNA